MLRVGARRALVPRHVLREDGRGGIADRQALAVGRDGDVGGHAHAGGGAVGGEDNVVVEVHLGEVGQLAVVALHVGHVLELELLRDVGVPVAAEALKVDDGDRLRAEQRPHGHLDRASVRRRHDADQVVLGQAHRLKQVAGQLDGAAQLVLANLVAVRAAERGVGERADRVAGPLLAGARRELRAVRLDSRLGSRSTSIRHRGGEAPQQRHAHGSPDLRTVRMVRRQWAGRRVPLPR